MKRILQEQAYSQQQKIKKKKIHRALLALSICHNVTPVVDNDVRGLQGSSPDQLTLVSFAESLGFAVQERNEDSITISGPFGKQFKILDIFPFSSESKSMGIVVSDNNQIVYYLKGADAVMSSKIGQIDANFMSQACLDLAR